MRSLCIAAFLRCLHASVEYAPTFELNGLALNNLIDDEMFYNITQLCSSTGWCQANIGTKYLQVMRCIMRLPMNKPTEDASRLKKYEIFVLVLQKILQELGTKIQSSREKVGFTSDDKVTISWVSTLTYEIAF